MKTRACSFLWFSGLLFPFFAQVASAQWSASPDANTAVCREDGDQRSPLVVSDGNRGAIFAWHDRRDPAGSDIYLQRVNAYGVSLWEEDGVGICMADSDQTMAGMVSDGVGGAIIVWYDRRGGSGDLYAQRVNGNGVGQWTPDGVPVAAGPGERLNAFLTSDVVQGIVVAWEQDSPGTGRDIFAQRMDATGGVLWAVGGVAACSLAGDQTDPVLVYDGTGGAIILWTDGRTPPETDIYAQRINGAGLLQWSPAGVAVCTVTGNQERLACAPDGTGGALVVWEDYRAGSASQVYVQGMTASGTPSWAPDGVQAAVGSGDQVVPRVASDDAGGAVVVWVDNRAPATAPDLYAQRLSSIGVPQWGSAGAVFCTASGAQDQLCIIPDGASGAIVAWRDARDGAETDIYAARFDAAGLPLWDADGVEVCTARQAQALPAVTVDGAGGAIVVWEDPRQQSARGFDIYAQNVNADGSRGLPSPAWVARYNNTLLNKTDGMGFKIKTAAKLLSRSLVVDRFGSSYVTGYSDGGTTKADYLTVKYDLFGVKEWEARYNGPGGKADKAFAIAVDNGDVYVTGESHGGTTGYDIATVKYDTAGAQLWVARYNDPAGGKKDAGYAIALVPGEDIVCVTGASDGGSGGKINMVTVAYNATTGAQLWVSAYNGPGGSLDRAFAMEAFSLPGGLKRVVITGESDGGTTKADYATVLYDAETGTQLWAARYDGPLSKKDYAMPYGSTSRKGHCS